jgi:hypothetical protein
MSDRASDLSHLLQTVLRRAEASYPDRAHRVWEVWEEAVGPELAKRSAPLSLRRGRLVVAVTTAPWMQQLSFLRETIRDSLNRALGHDLVREVRFRLATPEPAPPPRAPAPPPPWLDQPLDPAALAAIDEEVSVISDLEVRRVVREARCRAEQVRRFREGREATPPRGSSGRRGRGGRGET